MKYILALALCLAIPVTAAPFVQASVAPGITQCGFYLDSSAKVVVPATAGVCTLDLAGTAVGTHSVTATALLTDATWGDQESAKASPLAFARPAAPGVPTGLQLTPSSASALSAGSLKAK